MNKPHNRYTTKELIVLRKLLEQGLTYRQIAERMNRTVPSISNTVRVTLKWRHLYQHAKEFTPTEVIERIKHTLLTDNLAVKDIAQKYQVPFYVVQNLRKKLGLVETKPLPLTKSKQQLRAQSKIKLKDLLNSTR